MFGSATQSINEVTSGEQERLPGELDLAIASEWRIFLLAMQSVISGSKDFVLESMDSAETPRLSAHQ